LNVVHRLLWRSACILCRNGGVAQRDLCEPCEADLPRNLLCCHVCAQPFAVRLSVDQPCGACLRREPHFDASSVPFRYEYPMDRLIQRLKYGRDLSTGRVLGELFAKHLLSARSTPLPGLIVPVPLATRRFRERGYNQAIELARHIARLTHLQVRADVVERTRETLEQAALARAERRRNVRDAFTLAQTPSHPHIAILDDVVTTGSTVNEIAKLLRHAGATTIEVWAVARAGK
jgi:ComF family protein